MGLKIFQQKHSYSYNGPHCTLHLCKKLGRSLELIRSKIQIIKKRNTFFGHLIPCNPELTIFFGKNSCSNNGPYYPLHSYQKLGISFEAFCSKIERSKKYTFFGHLIPYNLGLRIFSENNLSQTMYPNVLYTHAKNWEDP